MLKFNVFNQKLARIDKINPATDSVEYLEAQFIFNTDDWNGKTKSAIFTKGTSSYTVLLDSKGVCKVPFEVLQSNESSKLLGNTDKISVSLVGIYNTVRITTNEVKINLNYSGYSEGQEPSEPTAEMYEQILTAYADAEAKCEETQQAFSDTLGLYANAIKGNVSGTTVTADDVSPIEHNVDVCVRGKNLLPYGTINITKNMQYKLDVPIPAGTYTISATITSSDIDSEYSSVSINDGSGVLKFLSLKRNERVFSTFTVKKPIENIDFCAAYNYAQGIEDTATWTDIQLEKGSIVTDYEPYIDPTNTIVTVGDETFTASSNGTVEGIKSTALANGITTEAEGMTIDVEYNKDINVVLNKIVNALGIEI